MPSPTDIVLHPSSTLRRVSRPVGGTDPAVLALVRGMELTLALSGGVGLAAIQVGVPLRIFLMRLPRDAPGAPATVLLDPEVTWLSDATMPSLEGCLSIRGPARLVTRREALRVAYTGIDGARGSLDLSGRAAAIVQHEMDHLDGRLILDLAPHPAVPMDAAADPGRPAA